MKAILFGFLIICCSCSEPNTKNASEIEKRLSTSSLVILGTVQDGGSPHIGCKKKCCIDLFGNPDPTRKVVSLGLIDSEEEKTFIIEASPDLPEQMRLLNRHLAFEHDDVPDGIFVTHAHIGHYTGLMYLGRESLGAKDANVYVMPAMRDFLETNGPWDQLIKIGNIKLNSLANTINKKASKNISIQPFLVPHRDEYSETVGFKITGSEKNILFIPDIDKWSKWNESIIDEIAKVDYAFIDATFYSGEEINNRDISEIPHPFVIETMALFDNLPRTEREKIHLIHLNHTNPLLDTTSTAYKTVTSKGYNVAKFNKVMNI